jgi:hypothetical protein
MNTPHKLYVVIDIQLCEHTGAVLRTGGQTDLKFFSYLFHRLAGDQQIQDFAFPRSEPGNTVFDVIGGHGFLAILSVLFDGLLNLLQQVLLINRLFQERKSTAIESADTHCYIRMSRNYDDRQATLVRYQVFLEFQSAHTRHTNVKHETSRSSRIKGLEEFVRR